MGQGQNRSKKENNYWGNIGILKKKNCTESSLNQPHTRSVINQLQFFLRPPEATKAKTALSPMFSCSKVEPRELTKIS